MDGQPIVPAGWEHARTHRTKDSIVHLYKKKKRGTGLLEWLIDANLPVPCEVLYSVFTDAEYRLTWDEYMMSMDTFEKNESLEYVHSCVQFPWPMDNRDYVFVRRAKGTEDGGYEMRCKSVCHSKKPETSDFIRVEAYDAVYLLEPADVQGEDINVPAEPRTHVTLTHFEDIKGSIPKWLVNKLVAMEVPPYLERVLEACRLWMRMNRPLVTPPCEPPTNGFIK